MIFRIGTIIFRIHPLLPIVWTLGILCGANNTLLASFTALCLHECGHILAAFLFKIPIEEIELMPFGGLMTCDMRLAKRYHRCILSSSGPLFSLGGYIICYFFLQRASAWVPFLLDALRCNLLLFLFNLLPVLPLDGGHFWLSCLESFPIVRRALTGAGLLVGILLICLSIYYAFHNQLLLSPAFAGCCLLYAAAVEKRDAPGQCLHALVTQRHHLQSHRLVRMNHYIALGDMRLIHVFRQLPSSHYAIIHVADEKNGLILGELDTPKLCSAVLEDSSRSLLQLINEPRR